jgi:hypothetical protein
VQNAIHVDSANADDVTWSNNVFAGNHFSGHDRVIRVEAAATNRYGNWQFTGNTIEATTNTAVWTYFATNASTKVGVAVKDIHFVGNQFLGTPAANNIQGPSWSAAYLTNVTYAMDTWSTNAWPSQGTNLTLLTSHVDATNAVSIRAITAQQTNSTQLLTDLAIVDRTNATSIRAITAQQTNQTQILALTAQQTNYATLISMLGPITNGLGAGAQTPLTADVNGAGKSITNLNNIEVTNSMSVATLYATNVVYTTNWDGALATNLNAANIAAGGTLSALNGAALTNAAGSANAFMSDVVAVTNQARMLVVNAPLTNSTGILAITAQQTNQAQMLIVNAPLTNSVNILAMTAQQTNQAQMLIVNAPLTNSVGILAITSQQTNQAQMLIVNAPLTNSVGILAITAQQTNGTAIAANLVGTTLPVLNAGVVTNLTGANLNFKTNTTADITLIDLYKPYAHTNHTANFTISGFSNYEVGATNYQFASRCWTNNSVGAKTITLPASWQNLGNYASGNTIYNTNIGVLSVWVIGGFSTNWLWTGR